MGSNLERRVRLVMVVALVALVASTGFASGDLEDAGISPVPSGLGDAKYVFLFIGDGMAVPQINAAEAYLSAVSGVDAGVEKLSFTQYPVTGLTTTYSNNAFITDSAAAATAIACGFKTNSGVIAMDPGTTTNFDTLAEIAKDAGLRVGIVSSVNLDHATPACFYAHEPSRSNYYNIGVQATRSDVDYFGGGMFRIDKTPDGGDSVHDLFDREGWTIVDDRSGLMRLDGSDAPVYAYNHGFASNALKYTIDQQAEDISLAEFTRAGIDILDNPDGFLMMVEAGKIDWACHANDAAAAIQDTIAFDDAIREAYAFYEEHPDETLIVVTGDHECGGLTLGFAGTGYSSAYNRIAGQSVSYEAFDSMVLAPYKERVGDGGGSILDLAEDIENYFGLTQDDLTETEMEQLQRAFARSMGQEIERAAVEDEYLLYGGYEPLTVTLTHIVNQKAGLAWTSYSHTGIPVPTFAVGAGAGSFGGYYDNTDIFSKTLAAMGLVQTVSMR